jgi:hypothetical protein
MEENSTLIDLIAVQGMDGAIVGTCMHRGYEALCYNFDKCVELVIERGGTEEEAETLVQSLAASNVEGAPVFVHFNEDCLFDDGNSAGRTIH